MNHGTASRISQVISARTIKELHYEASVEREIGVLRVLAHAGIARLVSCFRFMDGVCLTRIASLHGRMRTCPRIAWRRECARNTGHACVARYPHMHMHMHVHALTRRRVPCPGVLWQGRPPHAGTAAVRFPSARCARPSPGRMWPAESDAIFSVSPQTTTLPSPPSSRLP